MSSRFGTVRAVGAASALSLALAAPLLLPGVAAAAPPAATASVDGKQVTYRAADGQANHVTVTASKSGADAITYVIDDAVTITAGDGCSHPSAADRTKVTCTVTTLESQDPYATLEMGLGDRADTVTYTNRTDQAYYHAAIDLGSGKDKLTESSGTQGNSVKGGTGDDTLSVGRVTVVSGGDGKDTIRAAGGSIALGGAGNDTITSTGADSAAEGGAGDDVIRGGAHRQSLSGDDGDDTVNAGAGDDFVYGGKGRDVLYGDSGDDKLYGNSGDDKLYGGPGRDTLSGGPGRDEVHQS
ncbi:calcium-binding protein [Streptomyces sp. G45]|uniref:calcium-binding protein n=1 Tax=Streptomyces sp. G45 TaxID=3406627 RepID=UPI003C14C01C